MKRRPQSASIHNDKLDLMFLPGVFSSAIRDGRIRLGQTLRGLAALTGISHSEISKMESGNRECRLASLVHICAALGLPAGRLIDDITRSGIRMHEVVTKDPDFRAIIGQFEGDNATGLVSLAPNLGAVCAWALHLTRCSYALRAVYSVRYPLRDLEDRFVEFARRVDGVDGAAQRLHLAASFHLTPISALRSQGLFSDLFIEYVLADASGSIWVPLPETAFSAPDSGVDKLSEKTDIPLVKLTWAGLRSRLQQATEPRGKRAELARLLGVTDTSIRRWLFEKVEPGADNTFRLLEWVTAEEAKTKSSDSVTAPSEPKAPKKDEQDENPKSGPRKRSHKGR